MTATTNFKQLVIMKPNIFHFNKTHFSTVQYIRTQRHSPDDNTKQQQPCPNQQTTSACNDSNSVLHFGFDFGFDLQALVAHFARDRRLCTVSPMTDS